MDARDSKGLLGIKNYREELYEMCHKCGEKFLDPAKTDEHLQKVHLSGTMTAGGGNGSSVVKFCFPKGKTGLVQQYCNTCGERK